MARGHIKNSEGDAALETDVPLQAIHDALAAHGLPRRFRRSPHREKAIAEIQPDWLKEAWAGVLDRLAARYQPFAKQILVIVPPVSDDPIPISTSRGRLSRRIEVPIEFYWVVHDCALLWLAIEPAVSRALDDKNWRTTYDAEGLTPGTWGVLAGTAQDAARAAVVEGLPTRSFDAVQRLASTLKAPTRRARSPETCGCEGLSDHEEHVVKSMSAHALKFVIAHECGHHVLNHLSSSSEVAALGARSDLEGWLRHAEIKMPNRLKRAQVRELHCDVFAFGAVLAPELDPRSQADAAHLITNVAGTQLALVALDLLRIFSNTKEPEGGPPSHPPLLVRAILLIEMLKAQSRGLGLDGEDLGGSALELLSAILGAGYLVAQYNNVHRATS